jgi:rfaE bifunctional protein nucleotidyltransferase chain/domain
MNKIIATEQISAIKKTKPIVLVGGCFDILHLGHLNFFRAAKQNTNRLVILLESDKNVSKLKGINRPINNQRERAEILAAIDIVDYVILLPPLDNDKKYFSIIQQIRPKFIAITKNDPIYEKKKNQARQVGAKILVVPKTNTHSTTQLTKLLGID